MESSHWENWNNLILFCRKVSFLTALIINFEVYVNVWSRPICICGILYYKLNRIDPINKITKLNKYLVKDIIYNAEREIKSLG
jgi:hypothetical protein